MMKVSNMFRITKAERQPDWLPDMLSLAALSVMAYNNSSAHQIYAGWIRCCVVTPEIMVNSCSGNVWGFFFHILIQAPSRLLNKHRPTDPQKQNSVFWLTHTTSITLLCQNNVTTSCLRNIFNTLSISCGVFSPKSSQKKPRARL